eukprot:822700-Rhodomonas_salina.1
MVLSFTPVGGKDKVVLPGYPRIRVCGQPEHLPGSESLSVCGLLADNSAILQQQQHIGVLRSAFLFSDTLTVLLLVLVAPILELVWPLPMSYYLLLLLFVTEPEQAYLLSRIPLLASTLPTPSFHAFSMSRAAAAVVAACGFSVLGYRYSMGKPSLLAAICGVSRGRFCTFDRGYLYFHSPAGAGSSEAHPRTAQDANASQPSLRTQPRGERRERLPVAQARPNQVAPIGRPHRGREGPPHGPQRHSQH